LRLLLLDNYDSFTWNLAQYFAELGAPPLVKLNDEVDVAWCEAQAFDGIVLSPGPGRPEQAGISMDLVRAVAGRVPILGVCLGHQTIARVWGAEIVRAPTLMHGKTSVVVHRGRGLFAGLEPEFEATRYHSLVIQEDTLPDDFEVTARTPDRVIMAITHRTLPIDGVQFHPESILTKEGKKLLRNCLKKWGHS
jgi:anthranilate synthase/aminodeoxychorismate synthase-like glutamine amidotransferase